jgi:hypothetical protein
VHLSSTPIQEDQYNSAINIGEWDIGEFLDQGLFEVHDSMSGLPLCRDSDWTDVVGVMVQKIQTAEVRGISIR